MSNHGNQQMREASSSPLCLRRDPTPFTPPTSTPIRRAAFRRFICEPTAVVGAEVAARSRYAAHEPNVTGSLGVRREASHRSKREKVDEEDE